MSNSYPFDQYVKDATRTESIPTEQRMSNAGIVGFLRLAVVASKMIGAAKAVIYYNRALDRDKLGELTQEFALVNYNLQELDAEGKLITTESHPGFNLRLLHGGLGMFDEAGEICEHLYNAFTKDTELDTKRLLVEIADSDWFKALIHDELKVDEDTGRRAGIAKLKERFPDKFSEERANNRDTDKEDQAAQAVLESQ